MNTGCLHPSFNQSWPLHVLQWKQANMSNDIKKETKYFTGLTGMINRSLFQQISHKNKTTLMENKIPYALFILSDTGCLPGKPSIIYLIPLENTLK